MTAGWYKRLTLLCAVLLFGAMALQGCQTPPPPPPPGLSPEQVSALRGLGFIETDESWELDLAGQLQFDTDKDQLTEEDTATIERVAGTLLSVGINKLRVEGHADNMGPEAYNVALSLRRAETVARKFAEYGIPYENIQKRGMGVSHPIGDNKTREGRDQNRRAVIIVGNS